MSKMVFRTMTPVFEASKVMRAYREISGVSAAEIVAARNKLDRARHSRINSEVAEILIGAIPGAPAEKSLDSYVTAVIATADAGEEMISPLSVACTVGALRRKNKTLPAPDVFSAWHRAELGRIGALARALDDIPVLTKSRPADSIPTLMERPRRPVHREEGF
jgi:hypothetical protein